MAEEQKLIDKLRRIEGLFAGAAIPDEMVGTIISGNAGCKAVYIPHFSRSRPKFMFARTYCGQTFPALPHNRLYW